MTDRLLYKLLLAFALIYLLGATTSTRAHEPDSSISLPFSQSAVVFSA